MPASPTFHRNGNTLTQAFSRIEASKSAAKVRVADAFKNEAGAFDLPSILVGVVVVGILTAGVLASIFGVIPFSQDKAAQQDLGAVTTAQGVYKAQGNKAGTVLPGTTFTTLATLKTETLIGTDVDAAKVASSGDNDEWASASKSDSGKYYVATSKNSTPVLAAGTPADVNAALATVWDSADTNATGTAPNNNVAGDGVRILK